jgi:hypothetical protein
MRRHPQGRSTVWRIRCARLAALALLWGLLAPLLLPAQATSAGRWVEVCSSLGTRFVLANDGDDAVTSDEGAPDPAAFSGNNDCPYCRLHASLAPPLAPPRAPAFVCLGDADPPRPAERAASADPPWCPALPRAPPATAPA